MTPLADALLLRDFARTGSERAFGELVLRHTNLVYSAAFRQTNCHEIAREITQEIFIDLARKAPALAEKMHDDATLGGWLYTSTRYLALNAIRDERRRVAREQMLMPDVDSTPAPDAWAAVAPVLDEAMAELNDPEREAVVLRYFQNLDFHAVGRALGVSDDTAQKRVTRAVEHLRELLAKKGVTVGGSGLAILISTNAVLVAPAGLNAAIIAATVTATATTVATTATIITMTTMQKAVLASVLAAAVTVGIYQANEAATERNKARASAQQNAGLANQLAGLVRERDELAEQLASARGALAESNRVSAELLRLRAELTRLRQSASDQSRLDQPMVLAALDWSRQVELIKARFDQTPGAKIPELEFLSDREWLALADRKPGRMERWDDADWAPFLAELRTMAKHNVIHRVGEALQGYIMAHDGQLPDDMAQIAPYYKRYAGNPEALTPELLARYQLLHRGWLRDVDREADLVAEVAKPAYEKKDTRFFYNTIYGYYRSYVGRTNEWIGSSPYGNSALIEKYRKPRP